MEVQMQEEEEAAEAAEVWRRSLVRAQLPSAGYCNSLSVRVLLLLLEEPLAVRGALPESPCTIGGKLDCNLVQI